MGGIPLNVIVVAVFSLRRRLSDFKLSFYDVLFGSVGRNGRFV